MRGCILWAQIGNPLLDLVNDFNARDKFMWSHGVISDSAYMLLSSICNTSRFYQEIFQGFISSDCIFVFSEVSKQLSPLIDDYNVIGDVCSLTAKSQPSVLLHPLSSFITKSVSQRHLLSHPQVRLLN